MSEQQESAQLIQARDYARRAAACYGLEQEVMEHFERYIAAGDEPWQAANCALYDWDI